MSNKDQLAEPDEIAGIAFSCILGVLEGLAVTRKDVTPRSGMLLWLAFVILAGIAIRVSPGRSVRRLLAFAVPTSLAFVVTMVFEGAIEVIAGSVIVSIASVGAQNTEEVLKQRELVTFGVFYLLLFVINVPSVVVAIY